MYQGQNGKTYVGFGDLPKLIDLERLLPENLHGMGYETAVSSKSIGQYFDLASAVLISADAFAAYAKAIKTSGASKANPFRTSLPAPDLDYLRARGPTGDLLPGPMAAVFSIVGAYWESKGTMAVQPGLVTSLWRRGMSAEDIVRCIRASTDKNGKMITAAGRGNDIMHIVIETYLAHKGLSRDAELPQEDMAALVERWLTSTRSSAPQSKDAANTVLHWSDYRQLGLINDTGAVQPDQVRRVAQYVFKAEGLTFETLSDWVQAHHTPQASVPSTDTKSARAMLKKKRKQGKLNRKRGRR